MLGPRKPDMPTAQNAHLFKSGAEPLPWAPSNLADLVAWYDASDSDTITHSLGAVSQWDDKSTSGYDLTQGTGAEQPTTNSRTQNSLNVIDFDGGDQLESTAAAAIQAGDDLPYSLFCVATVDDDTPQPCLYSWGDSGDSNRYETMYMTSAAAITQLRRAGGTTKTFSDHTGDTSAHVFGYITSGTAGETWYDGTGGGGTSDMDVTTLGTLNQFSIGSFWRPTSSNYLNGMVGEVVIADAAIGTTDRQKLEGYLAHKWGLESLLPGGHPYKSEAP